jgi:hypothetical protein
MGLISKDPVIVGAYPTGALQPQPMGGSTLVLDGATGAVASVHNGVLGEAPAGSNSSHELCWLDGQFLVFRPTGEPVCYFKYTPDGVGGV